MVKASSSIKLLGTNPYSHVCQAHEEGCRKSLWCSLWLFFPTRHRDSFNTSPLNFILNPKFFSKIWKIQQVSSKSNYDN